MGVLKSSCNKKTCVAVIPAAGSGSRMKECGNKLFQEVGGIPVIVRTLQKFENSPFIDSIIIPTREDMVEEIQKLCRDFSITKVQSVVCGGKTRTESVLNGILAAGGKFDLVAIHDAARPFVSEEIIERTVLAASRYNAAAPAVPLKDTIKEAEGGIIKRTIPRDTLMAIQTPQIFDTALITSALTKALREGLQITDDCSAVELLGMRVIITNGDYFNIKITTAEDLIFAEAISKNYDLRTKE